MGKTVLKFETVGNVFFPDEYGLRVTRSPPTVILFFSTDIGFVVKRFLLEPTVKYEVAVLLQ